MEKVHSFVAVRLKNSRTKNFYCFSYYLKPLLSAGKIGPYLINLFTLSWVEKSSRKDDRRKN